MHRQIRGEERRQCCGLRGRLQRSQKPPPPVRDGRNWAVRKGREKRDEPFAQSNFVGPGHKGRPHSQRNGRGAIGKGGL